MQQNVQKSYEIRTRKVIHKLLTRILKASDTYEKHKAIKYKPFLGIQLELIKQIIATESEIRVQKKAQNQSMLEETRKRRRLLKMLGSTIGWTLLEFDRSYIRAFSRNPDPGFISGKKGFKLEKNALLASFNQRNCAGVLHDITNCLRVGDLSVIHPNHLIQTIELKAVKNYRKMGGREHRQHVRGRDLREYYDSGRSNKIGPSPSRSLRRHIARERDRHNWKQLCEAIRKAEKQGVATKSVEKCLTYVVFDANVTEDALSKTVETIVARFKKTSDASAGFLSDQFRIPTFLPLTCFEIPQRYKEKLLFGDIGVCVFVDLRRLAETLSRHGFRSSVIRYRNEGLVRIKVPRSTSPLIMKEGLIGRFLYEFTSVDTIIGYTRELSHRAKHLFLEDES
jgi:hypothetical protein